MAIRYDKKINTELNKTIKNFNNKIRRLQKLNDDNIVIPDLITKKDVKSNSYTRKELKRRIRELQSFSKRGAEKKINKDISLYEFTNLKKESSRLKRNLTREINILKTTSPRIFGEKTDATFAQMGDSYYNSLKAKRNALNKDIKSLSKKDLNRYKSYLKKLNENNTYRQEKFRESFLEILLANGYYYGYDKEKLKEIQNKISLLNSSDFLHLFNNEKAVKAILDYYPFVTGSIKNINIDDIKDDVVNLYESLYDNLDNILKDYSV